MNPEEDELLRDLTIVIPTFNRLLDLERAIEYWRDTPITVHILDGSQNSSFAEGKLPGIPTITYHHFPGTDNELLSQNYRKRLKFASTLPKTKYSALIGEDDFFTISGLCECLRVLSTEKGLCSVSGLVAGFDTSSGVAIWGLRDLRSQEIKAFESRKLNQRLKALKTINPPVLYYGIFKTECWKNTFKFSTEPKFKTNIIGGERLIHSVAATLGPTKLINEIYWLRRYTTTERTNFENASHERGEYDRYLNCASNKIEVAEYYGVLARAIVTASPSISRKKALRLSKMILKPNFMTSQTGRNFKLRKKLARFMVTSGRILPKDIRRLINQTLLSKISGRLGFENIGDDSKLARNAHALSDLVMKLRDMDIVFDRSEIEGVEKLLLKPREELRLHAKI